MTARLLPALQECFKSEYVSVRIEAAMVTKFCRFTTVCDKLESRFPFFCVIGYYYHYHHHHFILLQLLLLTIQTHCARFLVSFRKLLTMLRQGAPSWPKLNAYTIPEVSDKSPGTNVERAGEIYTANPG